MKHLRIAFGLVVMAGLMAVAAAPAMAANARWEQCKKVETAKTGNWKNALCSEAQKEGEWLTMEVTETEEVTSSGKVILTDLNAEGAGKASTVECAGTDRGWIGKAGGDGETEVTATTCTRVEGLCGNGTVKARAVNLPWFTQLEIREGKIRDKLTSANAEGPGYVVECTVLGFIEVVDKCAGALTTGMSNSADGNVQSEFDAISATEKGKCEKGGAESGRVQGSIHLQQRKEVATYVNIR